MSHDVFICYSARDRTVANTICAVLEAEGVRCWIAPRDILPGADWGESIIDAINDAKAMVLVFSSNANDAQSQIKREVERAVNKGISVIPLRIENVLPTKSLEYFLSTPHWLDAFNPPLDEHVRQLAYSIKRLLGKQAGERPNLTAAPPPMPMRPAHAAATDDDEGGILGWVKKPLHAGLIAAAALVIAVGLWWMFKPGATPEDQQAWNAAAVEDSIPGYALYLRQEPAGYFRTQATDRSDALKSEVDEAFAKAKAANTAAAYQSFMQTYAKQGVDIDEARDAYANADAQEGAVRAAYRSATATRSRGGYQAFLTQYGSSSYAADVRQRLASCHSETQTGGSTQSSELEHSATGSGSSSTEACNQAHTSAASSLESDCSAAQGRMGALRVVNQNAQAASSVGSAAGRVAGSLLGGALFGGGRSVDLGTSSSSYQCTVEAEAACEKTISGSRQVDVCP